MSTSEVFKQFFAKLAKSLPMDDPIFVVELSAHDLLPGDHYDKVKSLATRAEKATHFLDSVIRPAIITNAGIFDELLDVMEDSEFCNVKELAQQIRCKLKEEPVGTDKTGVSFETQLAASHLWTQQDLVQMVSVDTKEAIPLPKDIRDEVLNSVVIWLVTMNKNETSATHVYLQRLDDKYVYKHIDQKTEDITYYIGKYGAYPAALCNVPPDFKSDGGTSISKITYGLFRNIIVVINVGVVCGIENKVKMCDVLVSSEIVNYDKVGVRGETITVSPRLTRLFTQSINMWPYTLNIQKRLNDNEMVMPVVKSGIILSGPHLAEDQVIKTAIPENIASEPIGIEMEGIYPFTQTQLTMTNVITVKAVCDFGDGQNNEIYQPTAALLAADLVHECLKSDQAHEIFEGKKLLHEMVQKAKDEGLTINVRHAKILFCGAPQVGKTSFSRLLRNKKHKELGSTDAGHAKQVLISGKVNVIGEEWINLDRKLEMQTLTEILNLKMREQDETTEEKSSQTNSNTNREPIADNTLDVQTNNQTVTQATNSDYGNEPIQATNSDYGNEPIQATNSDYGNEPILQSISRNKPAADIQKSAQPYPTRDSTDKNESVEEEMTDISFFKLKESIPDTWDLFTFLDTGGQPEFINMLPAINASTDITFIVIDISEGRKCLNNEIKAIYKHENYEYGEQILKYSNRDLLKCLLSSAKVASTKKDQFHPELIKQVSKNKQLEKVVYIIGTFADILKKTSLTREKYDEEVCEIENEIKKLVEVIQEEGVLVCHCNEVRNYLNPIDNKVPRDFQKNVMDKESDMQAIQSNTIDTVLQIHGHANEILKNTAQYEIPFTWFILELQLRKSKKVCIPLSEVKSICDYHKIIPPHRKLKDDQIQEVLKFYHTYGMLLYFDAVEGMNNFVITDPRWLFTNLTKIVMYQFKKDVNDLDGICMQKMHNGICNLELLSKLELDLHGIELESFVKLLENLKIAARMNNSYFIPTMLPLCINTKNMFTADEFGTSVILTDDGLCKEVEPLLIKHSFGTIPRGLFGFLVVQLLQDNSKTSEKYELHGLNDRSKGLFYRCADLITFFVYPCFYVCLCDKISYLEIKIRANGNEPSYHYKAQCVITKALEQVCNRFDWAFNEHRYGFLCHKTTGSCRESPHLTLLPRDEIFPPEYAHCKNNQPTKLDVCHQIWFKNIQATHYYKAKDEDTKSGNKEFDCAATANVLRRQLGTLTNLNFNAMVDSLYAKEVITNDERRIIDDKIGQKKMRYLIADIIIPSLRLNLCKKYKGFLEAMKESDNSDLRSTAERLVTATISSRYDSSEPLAKKPKTESHNEDENDQEYTSPNNEGSKGEGSMEARERSRRSNSISKSESTERNLDSHTSRSYECSKERSSSTRRYIGEKLNTKSSRSRHRSREKDVADRRSRSNSRDRSKQRYKERSSSTGRYIGKKLNAKTSRSRRRSREIDVADRRSRSRERNSRAYYSSHSADVTMSIYKSKSPQTQGSSKKHKRHKRSRSASNSRCKSRSPQRNRSSRKHKSRSASKT